MTGTMTLHLVDTNPALVRAWRETFALFPEVGVRQADLLAVASNAVVSPANGYGFMDGGIDAAYVRFFGNAIEGRVRDAVAKRPEGYLPVGAGVVIATGHDRIPHLIVAPTMLMPEAVPSQNCYRALRAVLRIASAVAEVGRAVYCPGLGTGVGGVPAEEAAKEMARAYGDWKAAQDSGGQRA
jgi:O-acetyl-ADP-ribose deacetylase (regulator of RNase III)